MRKWLAIGCLSVLLAAAASAGAAEPPVRQHGAWCPPTGCRGTPASPAGAGLAYAAAALATVVVARRRSRQP